MVKTKLTPEDNKEIAETIDLFKHVNSGTAFMFGNTTQRKAVQELLKVYGFEKIKKCVEFIPVYNDRVKDFYKVYDPHALSKHLKGQFSTIKIAYDREQRVIQKQLLEQKKNDEEAKLLAEMKASVPPTELKKKFTNIMEIIKNA